MIIPQLDGQDTQEGINTAIIDPGDHPSTEYCIQSRKFGIKSKKSTIISNSNYLKEEKKKSNSDIPLTYILRGSTVMHNGDRKLPYPI